MNLTNSLSEHIINKKRVLFEQFITDKQTLLGTSKLVLKEADYNQLPIVLREADDDQLPTITETVHNHTVMDNVSNRYVSMFSMLSDKSKQLMTNEENRVLREADNDQLPAITETIHNPTVMDNVSNRSIPVCSCSDMPLVGVLDPFSSRAEGCSSTSSSVDTISQQANKSSGVKRGPDKNNPKRRVKKKIDDSALGSTVNSSKCSQKSSSKRSSKRSSKSSSKSRSKHKSNKNRPMIDLSDIDEDELPLDEDGYPIWPNVYGEFPTELCQRYHSDSESEEEPDGSYDTDGENGDGNWKSWDDKLHHC